MKTLWPPYVNFVAFFADTGDLIGIHDQFAAKRKPGNAADKRGRNLDVLRRAGIILIVTAWETFIEDALRSAFSKRLETAKEPNDVHGTFNAIANAWLEEKKRNNDPIKPPELLLWAGEGWKQQVREKFEKEVESMNTPNSEKIEDLFKRYLGHKNFTQHWAWNGTTPEAACQELNELIQRRGALVHRAESSLFAHVPNVSIVEVKKARLLILELVGHTMNGLGLDTF